MKLFFSEYKSDYANYIFPYAIWAVPEPKEKPSDIFARGFLPNSRFLDRFYMCRQVRIDLGKFELSSENRRILRKGKAFEYTLVDRADFNYTPVWRAFCKTYADKKFGANVMSNDRLYGLFSAPIVSHVLLFRDQEKDKDVGLVMLYLEPEKMGFYYYSFYDLDYFKQSLGMIMMTTAVTLLKERNFEHIYLGSCYSRNAMYKTQFAGAEFFNGFRWSDDLQELKFLINRDAGVVEKHLLESEDFIQKYYPTGIATTEKKSFFNISIE
ncbi:MAG: hypothetical protein GWP06_16280 [Actinobacteria bacterium]|nr:hypothetical protein [Actinomycetota bacterium]